MTGNRDQEGYGMIKFKGINHIAFATNDMDKTIRFWRDLLGLPLVAGLGDTKGKQYFFRLSDTSMISFFEWPDVQPVEDRDPGRPFKGPLALDHICLELEDEDQLWELKAKLQAADIWVSEVIDNGFIHSLFSTDPNNLQLEFCYNIEGAYIKAGTMLDSRPSAITKEGIEPQPGKWPKSEEPESPEKRKIYPGELKIMTGKRREP